MTTPNDIDVLLHYHCSPTLHPRADAPAVAETTGRFVRDGILEACDGGYCDGGYYRTTERGQAWIEMILRVPYPKRAWVDESGNVVLRHNVRGKRLDAAGGQSA